MKLAASAGMNFYKSASPEIREEARAALRAIVYADLDTLVETFYSAFLKHPEGHAFLDHSVVHERLGGSMKGWLRLLVDADLENGLDDYVAFQRQVGTVHARMKVPNHIVLEGASMLKTSIAVQLVNKGLPAAAQGAALIILDEILDFSICVMSESYVIHSQQRARTEEAFRHLALGQDLIVERETQRAALMEWSHSVLFALLGSQERRDVRKLSASPFGLWLRHRAGLLFPDSAVVEDIEKLVAAIDGTYLPAVTDHVPRSFEAVATLEERIEELRFLLNDLFQIVTSADAGRDPLTRALNRRFLPSVLGREMALAGKHETPLCLALVDIDHFKRVNDSHGHAAGDAALRHVADYLMANVRSSDFVFRYGGEEFLIVFCETDLRAAQSIAQRICSNLAQESIQLPDGGTVVLTASIGVAPFEGHPDYEFLLQTADTALYQAKNSGRNRVVTLAAAHAA